MDVVDKMLGRINRLAEIIAAGDATEALRLAYDRELACLFQYVNMLNIKSKQKYIVECSGIIPAASSFPDISFEIGKYSVSVKL